LGEWGAFTTPHDVVLAWMESCLENWRRAGIGWALWNLRTWRADRPPDVAYEPYRAIFDRQMLDRLRKG
jgi:hypothetical protein